MAKHAPKPAWILLCTGRWAQRLRIAGPAAVLLVLVAGGIGWAIAGDPKPGSLPLRPPPSLELDVPPTLGTHGAVGSQPPSAGGPSTEGAGTDTRPTPPASRRTARPGTTKKAPAGTPRTTAAAPTKAATTGGLTAKYVLGSTWDDGLVAGVIVGNPTGTDRRFEVRITYPADYQVRVQNAWNATLRSGAGTIVLAGGPIRAGGELMIGFQASKARPSTANPTSCTVVAVTG